MTKSTFWGLCLGLCSLLACDAPASADTTDASTVTPAATPVVLRDTTPPVLPKGTITFDDDVTPEERQKIMEKISRRYLMGQFDPKQDERFVRIPSAYANKEMYIRKEALVQFERLHEAAKKDGITFTILSATRPFNVQKAIWEAKWTGRRKVDGKLLPKEVKDPKGRATQILRWSSMPSTSRHHWGTDIDLNSLEPSYFESGKGLKEYEWLVANAPAYGFCQVYSAMGPERPYGYQEEKWHWSYLPISKNLTAAYAQKITDQDIQGFLGAESAPMIEVVQKYVLGINPACL